MSSKTNICGLAAALLLTGSGYAASISNGNFDADTIGSFTSAAGTDWTLSGTGGLLNIDINNTAVTSGASSPNVAWVTGGTAFHSQSISENVADNLQLQLTFDVSPRADAGSGGTGFTAGLFTAAGTPLATATQADVTGGLVDGQMKTVTVDFNAGVGHGQLGQAIEVRLGFTTGGQIVFDDVAISVVPEPTTYALVSGLGLLGVAAYRRRSLRNKA